MSLGAAPITGYGRRSTAACAPRCSAALRSPRAGRRRYGPSSQYGVACFPWAEPYASTNWLGRHQAGPSFVFCRPSLMFAGAYLLGFGRAISLKEPPCGLKGPFADSDSSRAKGRAPYSRAQTRHSPGYSLETALLPASKHLRIDQLNVEMGAPPSWKRQRRGGHGRLPCRAALDLVKRLAGHGLDGLLYGAALPASKRSFGGTKCVMPALPFCSWVCEW